MRFKVFTVVKVWIVVFWDVMPCSLVAGYQSFVGTYCMYPEDEDGDTFI
jgi:hypothetical protein